MVTTSTTLTATRTTTTSRIWNASRLAIISAITGTSHHLIAGSPTSKIRDAATERHRSDAGREWHREHGRRAWESRIPVERKCEQCGGEYTDFTLRENARFCSNKCKSAWRRASGVDDEDRTCIVCGRRSESTSSLLHELAPVYVERVVAQTERRAVYNLTVSRDT